MTIKARDPVRSDPVRSDFAGCSTGSYRDGCDVRTGYYETKGHAVDAFNSALRDYALHLDAYGCMDMPYNTGRTTIGIYDDCGVHVGSAILSWFRMCTGRYEFVGYIS